MREVVARRHRDGPEGDPRRAVHGKTGTAEFGTKNPPETHAWFVGYQGDVAFAVLVEEGKSGGTRRRSGRQGLPHPSRALTQR